MLHKYIAHNSLLPFYRAWQLDPEGYHYNLSFSYQLENSRHITCLTETLQKLIQLKGYLRQTFNVEKEQLIATIHDHLAPQINFFTISTEELAATEQRLAQEKHDINNRSSIKLNIIRFKNSPGCSVLFNIHHILLDGYGLDFFIMDLNRLLAGEKVEKESAIDYINKIKNEMPLQQWTEQPALVEYVNKINLIASDMESFSTSESDTILSYRDFLPNLILRNLASLSLQQN
ncbi:MAG: hypothetical protein K2Q33_00950, partial [Gammaproteobacteria bacterium]|nr:hypothetical protein [Gammaproteobacteria bacterium]